MADRSTVLINSGLYSFSSILVKAINFLLLPLYTLFLTPEDYGIINLINGFTSVATFIVAFSLYSAVLRFYADYKNEREKLKKFFGTIITFTLISGFVFVGFGFIFQEVLIKWFFKGITFFPVIVIGLFSLTFVCLLTVHQRIMQSMQTGKKLTVINLIVFGLNVGLNLLFIGVFKLGAMGILLAGFIINMGYFLFMIIDLKKNDLVSYGIDKQILRESLKYSIPLMPHNLSTQIASFASRIFINTSGSLSLVGIYSVSSQFGTIIDTVQTSVNRAFAPWFFDIMTSGESKEDIVSFSRFMLILYSLMYMGIGLFSQEAIIIMTNERYVMAWTVVPILVTAFSVKSIYYFYINILFYYKDAAKTIFFATISGSFADILLALILVPKYQIYGAAIAFLIAKAIIVSIVVVLSRKYNDIGYKITNMLGIIVPSLLFMGIGLYFSYTKYLTDFSWINLAYKTCILVSYLIYLITTNKKLLKEIINSKRIHRILKRGQQSKQLI